MLKRILNYFIVLVLLVSVHLPKGICETSVIKTYTVENNTAVSVTSYIAITSIIPNQSLIFGWTVAPTRSNAYSPLATLWDMESTTSWSTSSLIGESESAANTSKDKILPYPRLISNQLKVVLGPYSAIVIEYTK